MNFKTLDVHGAKDPLLSTLRRKSDATHALDQSPMAEAPVEVEGHSMSVGIRDKKGEGKPRRNIVVKLVSSRLQITSRKSK